MAKYNGHRSWNAWNVSLWIGNNESLYNLALDCIKQTKNRDGAVWLMLQSLPQKTPDGANYNYTCVREALIGLE